MSDYTSNAVTLSLSATAAHACTMCGRTFGSYAAWADRMAHSCACYNSAHPVLVESATKDGAVDPVKAEGRTSQAPTSTRDE